MLIDVTHTAVARDGRIFWLQAGSLVHRGWPFRTSRPDGEDDTTLLRQLHALRASHLEMRVPTRRGAAPVAGLSSVGARLGLAAGERPGKQSYNWVDASLRLSAEVSCRGKQ